MYLKDVENILDIMGQIPNIYWADEIIIYAMLFHESIIQLNICIVFTVTMNQQNDKNKLEEKWQMKK